MSPATRVTPALVLSLTLLGPAHATAAGATRDDIEHQVSDQLVGNVYVTKIQLANSMVTPAGTRVLVDTELDSTHAVRRQTRLGSIMNGIPEQLLTSDVENTSQGRMYNVVAGTRVRVMKVEAKNDRIEILLSTEPAGAYARLKLMFGKDFEKRLDVEGVLLLAASALRIDRFERRDGLQARFRQLQASLSESRGNAARATSAVDRLKLSETLKAQIEEAVANRQQFAEDIKRAVPEIDPLGRELAALDASLVGLRTAANAERVSLTQAQLGRSKAERSGLQAQATAAARTSAEWDMRRDAANKWQDSIRRSQAVAKELADLGAPDDAAQADLAAEARTAEQLLVTIDKNRKQGQLEEIRTSYQAMTRRRTQLLDAYTRAFGTPQQRESTQALISHLQQMINNRAAAAAAGDAGAAAQAQTLRSELERMSRR